MKKYRTVFVYEFSFQNKESSVDTIIAPVRKSSVKAIDIYKLREKAVEEYCQTSYMMRTILHADLDDDSEVFCIQRLFVKNEGEDKPVLIWNKRYFSMPKQMIIIRNDESYGRFVFVKVMDKKDEKVYWLVSQYGVWIGFLLPLDEFSPDKEDSLIPLKQNNYSIFEALSEYYFS